VSVIADTKQTIMDAAKKMVQKGGYSALSFRDLAAEVGVKSSSVHYHFPTKGDLGAALARKYTEDLKRYLDTLKVTDRNRKAVFKSYTDVFRDTLLQDNRMCMCGIMAAERDGLPPEVRREVDKFTDANVDWLVRALPSDRDGTVSDATKRQALAIFSAIEGAQLVSRGRGDIAAYDDALVAYRTAGLIP
jgi:TetR/AcrR family transcriptional repressor of nem operon